MPFWPITYPEDYKPAGTWFEENFKMDFDEFDGKAPGEQDYIDRLVENPSEPKPAHMPEVIADEARSQADTERAGGIEPIERDDRAGDALYAEIKEMEAKDEELYGPKYRDDPDEKER